jgi:hypothetical protein
MDKKKEQQPASADGETVMAVDGEGKPLSKLAAKKEAQRKLKMEKFQAKQAKLQAAQVMDKKGDSKKKKPSDKPEVEAEVVKEVPVGDKKGSVASETRSATASCRM